MALNEVDKAKIRVAVKCYLKYIQQEASARELYFFIVNLGIKLRGRLNPNILGWELTYCSKPQTRNLLNIDYYEDEVGNHIYFLKED